MFWRHLERNASMNWVVLLQFVLVKEHVSNAPLKEEWSEKVTSNDGFREKSREHWSLFTSFHLQSLLIF